MRIVHTCLRYPPASGGAEKYVYEVVERTRHIPERDVRVLTSFMRTHGPISELPGEALLDDPPYVQRLHHARTPLLTYPRLQSLAYYLDHHRPDIVQAYSFWYQPADAAARFCSQHNIPFIFYPFYYRNGVREKFTWQMYKKTMGRKTFSLADAVVVISPYEQSLIEKDGFPVKRFVLIPPGIDPFPFQQRRENPFIKKGITGPVLLTVSRLAFSKGLEDVIDALPTVRKTKATAQLVIVGEDFGALASLRKLAEERGIASAVHFWGKITDEDLMSAYQHADVFVHPSHYEAFGIVLAESLAAKTPVVARNVAAIPFVVPHNTAGLLFNTKEELATHIAALLSDPKRREALGEAGHRHVLANFTWDQSIKKLLTLYAELKQ